MTLTAQLIQTSTLLVEMSSEANEAERILILQKLENFVQEGDIKEDEGITKLRIVN